MVRIFALDVGGTTGIVVADVSHRQLPQVVEATECPAEEIIDELESALLRSFPLTIIAELPIVDPTSSTAGQVGEIVQVVEEWLKRKSLKHEIIRIRPSQWKSTPAGLVNIFSYPENQFVEKPSQHLKDAGSIAYWYAYFKL